MVGIASTFRGPRIVTVAVRHGEHSARVIERKRLAQMIFIAIAMVVVSVLYVRRGDLNWRDSVFQLEVAIVLGLPALIVGLPLFWTRVVVLDQRDETLRLVRRLLGVPIRTRTWSLRGGRLAWAAMPVLTVRDGARTSPLIQILLGGLFGIVRGIKGLMAPARDLHALPGLFLIDCEDKVHPVVAFATWEAAIVSMGALSATDRADYEDRYRLWNLATAG